MKSLLKKNLHHSSAVDMVMKPVLEAPEDESDGDARPQSSTGDHATSQEGESSESFQLAKRETAMVHRAKLLVMLVIVLVAIVVAVLTYLFVKEQEDKEYESKFHTIALDIAEFSQLRAKSVEGTMERLSVHITSSAESSNQKWPFVTIDDFQVKGVLANEAISAHTVSINPLVFPDNLDEWVAYSVEHQGWMAESHAFDKTVHEDLYAPTRYSAESDHDESLRWDKTGITPYVWASHNGEHGDAGDNRVAVGEEVLYVPVWQQAPAMDYHPMVNHDLRSNPNFSNYIDGMLAVHRPVITQTVNATYLDTNYDHRFDPVEQKEPHSYMLEPIYDSLTHNRSIVAVLASFLRWGTFFDNVLPDHENGIFVVMDSSCGDSFTYEMFGRKAVFLGEGDHHDQALDLELKFEFSTETQHESEGEHNFCHYYAHVRPSAQWRSQFYTSRPYAFAIGVLFCFAMTTVVFIAYDWLVQRRQAKVMKSAKRTNAIVNSLFPANVRDRLLEDIEKAENGVDPVDEGGRKSRISWSDPSMAMLQAQRSQQHNNCPVSSEAIFGSRPIADLFPATTIMFGDMVGFTAWSSVREPHQVFSLLETVYHGFDKVAKRRRVFKVETVGDCYVAVCGLPVPRKDHAVVMSKFATDCLHTMKELCGLLETSLGPDTAELDMRIGLHSGPVTAGVLRGDKGRFQLFGDTMNTASRLESTGAAGRIHMSRETAEALVAAGKEKWVTPRDDQVFAKGKGALTTYWMKIINGSCNTGSNSNRTSITNDSVVDPLLSSESIDKKKALVLGSRLEGPKTYFDQLPDNIKRLVCWNVDILVKILRQIIARRLSMGKGKEMSIKAPKKVAKQMGTVLDEVRDVLALPQFDGDMFKNHMDPNAVEISDQVVLQLRDMVARIAGLYQDNPFHSFEHASHVTMSVTKLLSRIVNPIEVSTREGTNDKIAADLHDHTFGITSDPLTQFACILSALIHDADHQGVPNSTLVKEEHPLASKYKNKSVAEQNSVDLAWEVITRADYKELQACIYGTKDEYVRFRSIVVNVVMATDIMDKDLGAQRKARWEKAFSHDEKDEGDSAVAVNRKATIVLEHLMQASDVSHTMQHFVVFKKWNERLFVEMYKAFADGRSDRDPSAGWYLGELGFFDYYIIPLAKKLETCGVFGVSSHEYLSYAQSNRREWEAKGQQMVKEYLYRFHNSTSNITQVQPNHSKETVAVPRQVQESVQCETVPVPKSEIGPVDGPVRAKLETAISEIDC